MSYSELLFKNGQHFLDKQYCLIFIFFTNKRPLVSFTVGIPPRKEDVDIHLAKVGGANISVDVGQPLLPVRVAHGLPGREVPLCVIAVRAKPNIVRQIKITWVTTCIKVC